MNTEQALPTLTVDSKIVSPRGLVAHVERSAPGFALVSQEAMTAHPFPLAWINGAWREVADGSGWTPKPSSPTFTAEGQEVHWDQQPRPRGFAVLVAVDSCCPWGDDYDTAKHIARQIAAALPGWLDVNRDEVQS